ncbi:hypothetical protein [Rhodococcus phenolicus]|nr:hypothetical protein [Rhodococcus phenolicus]
MFAPTWEKDLFAVLHSTEPTDYIAISRTHSRTAPHAHLFAAMLEEPLHFELGAGNPQAAREHDCCSAGPSPKTRQNR